MSGGHSEVVPRLPIPNRTVKRLSADDSADTRVKVGHRQGLNAKSSSFFEELFLFSATKNYHLGELLSHQWANSELLFFIAYL